MLNPFLRSPLMDPEPSAGGGNSPAGGDSQPGASAFDPAAFKAELFGEFNRMFNGFAKNLQKDVQKMIQPPAPASGSDPAPQPGNDPAPTGQGKTQAEIDLQRKLQALEAQLNQSTQMSKRLEEQYTRAEQQRQNAERDRIVTEALAGVRFASETARSDARELFSSKLKWSDNGELVAPDDVTMATDWIKQQISQRPHWIEAVPAPSAGAGRGANGGPRKWTLDDIDKYSSLSPDQQKELLATVQGAVLGQQ